LAKEQQWFFGGVERGSGKAFMEPVMARNAQTLLPILQKYVEPGLTTSLFFFILY